MKEWSHKNLGLLSFILKLDLQVYTFCNRRTVKPFGANHCTDISDTSINTSHHTFEARNTLEMSLELNKFRYSSCSLSHYHRAIVAEYKSP